MLHKITTPQGSILFQQNVDIFCMFFSIQIMFYNPFEALGTMSGFFNSHILLIHYLNF